jgi:hypothetical protein
VLELQELQEGFQERLDNLPENFQSSAIADRLQETIDIQSAIDVVNDAQNVELP